MKKRLEEFIVQKGILGEQVEKYLNDKSQPLSERMEVYKLMISRDLSLFSVEKESSIFVGLLGER